MLNSFHLPSGLDLAGALVLPMIVAVAALVVLVLVGAYAYRYAGQGAFSSTLGGGALGGGALVLLGALIATGLSWLGDDTALRRSIDTRAAELTARAIAPGSALACLDALANPEVEVACEKALFTSAETVANAIAYIDAKISLLAVSAPLAARDPSYQPAVERTRRALETDRFGMVAHVLHTRGCDTAGCADLKLLRNPGHVLANMKAQTFGTYVTAHAGAWQIGGSGVTVSSAAPIPSAGGPPLATIGAAHSTPVPSKFELPSAASIPAVNIMSAEPPGQAYMDAQPSQPRATAAQPAQPKRQQQQQAQQPRRQTSREAPSAQAPTAILPPPPPLPQTASPQTSGQR